MDNNKQMEDNTNFNDYNTKKVIDFETTPIVDIVNYILLSASKKNASDLHFDPADTYMKVRFRIDGKLDTFTIVPNSAKQNLVARLKILSGMNKIIQRYTFHGRVLLSKILYPICSTGLLILSNPSYPLPSLPFFIICIIH